MKLHDTVLAIINDLSAQKSGAGLTKEKLAQWMTKLSKPEVKRNARIFLDCVEASMRLHKAKQTMAAQQLIMLSAIGLNDGVRLQKQREGGDMWAKLKPSRLNITC